jgi:hypothetical protein
MLSQEAITEFQKLYKENYGIELSLEEASLRAHALINLYGAICLDSKKPYPEEAKNTKQYE